MNSNIKQSPKCRNKCLTCPHKKECSVQVSPGDTPILFHARVSSLHSKETLKRMQRNIRQFKLENDSQILGVFNPTTGKTNYVIGDLS